ncbi:MAG: hypothetical protein GX256_05535 [Fretibacterium sp.]|mgnify:CR=1 FL=1|nr:hypothetical protein [Fretibacterium sp.]
MHLIIGGRYSGKRAYALTLFPEGVQVLICDLAREQPEAVTEAGLAINLQEAVRTLLRRDTDATEFFTARLERLRHSVLVGDEVGSGVVPVDPFERLWRDETGFLYQMLAREAERVDRVWAGIPTRLKG